jgi:hypothetical protein
MTLQVVGALCIVIALIGGGLKVSEVEIPRLSELRIIALVAVGAVFVGLGLLTGEKSVPEAPPVPASTAHTNNESSR